MTRRPSPRADRGPAGAWPQCPPSVLAGRARILPRARRRALAVCLLVAGLAAAGPARAATVIKMATLVPDGSVWHQILKAMEGEWSRDTAGRVVLRIYAGGVAGDDPDMVRKMRIGQLQAAALTVTGLAEIDDAFKAFQMPLFFDSYEELFHVLDRMTPVLAQRLDDKGFVLLNWGQAGWVHLFSTRPVATIEDLKALKLFSWAGDDQMTQWWKRNGFQPVALASTDILTGLETGMIQALPTTPLAALTLQWFRRTPHMLGLGIAPLVGGSVVTRKAWDEIAAEDRSKLLASARRTEERLETEIPEQDRAAVEEMTKRGLQVARVEGAAAERWRAEAQRLAETMRGSIVPPDVFDLVLRERDAYRREGAAGGGS